MLTCSASPQSLRRFAKNLRNVHDRRWVSLPQKGVLLKNQDGMLSATVTDGNDLILTMEVPADGMITPLVLFGETFLDAIRNTRSFSLEGGTVRTDTGTVQAEVMDPEALFPIPSVHRNSAAPEAAVPFTSEVLDFGTHAASQNPTKPILSATLLDLTLKGLVRIVSTDGMRLAIAELPTKAPKGGRYSITPKAIRVLRDLVSGSEPILIRSEDGYLSFQGKGWRLTTKVVEGWFPEYTRVLPTVKSMPQILSFKREEFLTAVNEAAKARDDYHENIQMLFADGKAFFELRHSDGPVSSSVVDYHRKGADSAMELAFHRLYLQDLARLTPGKALRYHFTDDIRQGIFTHERVSEGWACMTTLMPVKFAEHLGAGLTPEEAIRQRVREGVASRKAGPAGLVSQAEPKILKQVARVIGLVMTRRRTTLPILQFVHLSGGAGILKVAATDMELTFTAELPCTGSVEPTLVNGEPFRAILKSAQNFSVAEGALSTPSFKTKTEPAEFFPLLPELHTEGGSSPVTRIPFTKDVLAFGAAAAAGKSFRPGLTAGLLELSAAGGVILASTDGFRLNVAACQQDLDEWVQGPIQRVLLPQDVFQVLQVLHAPGQSVSLEVGDKEATFRGDGWALTSRRVNDEFPAYRKALPDPSAAPETIQAPKKVLFEGIEEISRGISKRAWQKPLVECSIRDGKLLLCMVLDDQQQEVMVPIQGGSPLEAIRFNLDHLKDMAGCLPWSTVRISYGDTGPWTFQPLEDESWICRGYLMPDRPSADQSSAA